MKHLLWIIISLTLCDTAFSQIDHQNVYIVNSCPGDTIREKVILSSYKYGNFDLYFEGSNIPNLKASIK